MPETAIPALALGSDLRAQQGYDEECPENKGPISRERAGAA